MSHTPHELAEEFPDDEAIVHRLKTSNAHFARQAARYHDVNRAIHRIEAQIDPACDTRTETLKKQRLALADELRTIIARARPAA